MKIFSSLIILLEIVSLIYICTRYNKSYQSIDLNMLALTWQWHYVSCLEHKSTVRNFLPLNYCSLNEFALKKRNSFQNAALQLPSVWYFACAKKIWRFRWNRFTLARGGSDPHPFYLRPTEYITISQNGICGMHLPLCSPTLTRFAFRQNFFNLYIKNFDQTTNNNIV